MSAILTPADRTTDCWRHIKKRCEDRLQALRIKNDGNHDSEKTAKIRGAIDELKLLIALDAEKPEPPPEL